MAKKGGIKENWRCVDCRGGGDAKKEKYRGCEDLSRENPKPDDTDKENTEDKEDEEGMENEDAKEDEEEIEDEEAKEGNGENC